MHEDCHAGMYCRVKETWPFNTFCTKQKTTFEKCEEDIECQNNQYCWYPSKSFRELEVPSKVCLEQYSLDVGETFGWEAQEDPPTLEDFT